MGYALSDFTNGGLFNLIARDHTISRIDTCSGGGSVICSVRRGLTVNATATFEFTYTAAPISSVPVPAAIWLFGSGLLGLIGVARRKKS